MRLPESRVQAQEVLKQLYRAALGAADPLQVIPPHLPPVPKGRTVVVGVGKAAAAMAQAVEAHWQGPLSGVVVVPVGATRPLQHIRVLTGSHPVPDASSVQGGDALLQAVHGLQPDDLVIALVSGGGSALCAKPADGLTLEEKQSITRALLLRGASISEINTVRRHLSAIKGGRLAAAAYPARVVTLLISDIPGDEPTLIASGPTLPDATTCQDALAVLQRYGITHLPGVLEALEQGRWESIKPGDARLQANTQTVVASAWDGMQAASRKASSLGLVSHILSDAMEGEARDLAKAHAAIALSVAQRGVPFQAPCVVLSGGEATVTVRGKGRGGRNTEFALAFALALQEQKGAERIHVISAGTDGLDGRAEAAGAMVHSQTLAQGARQGLSAMHCLDTNDSATFLDAAQALVHTGPTFTNINDFRAVLIL
jgi:hydroxypyruvate reductase